MEAQFVSPAPQKAPQQFYNRTDNSSGESAFAPELSKALSDTNKNDGSSASSQPQNSENQSADNQKHLPQEGNDVIEQSEDAQASAGTTVPENKPEQSSTTVAEGKAKGPSETAIAAAAEKISNPVARENSALFKFTSLHGELQPAEKKALAAHLSQTGLINTLENQASGAHRVAAHLASNNAFGNTKVDSPLDSTLNTVLQKVDQATLQTGNNTLPVFNRQDTFTWTQQVHPADKADSRGGFAFLLNEPQAASLQIGTTTLSAENIMARLSQISGESGQSPLRGNNSLRDNTSASIRHDISGQFIQAKTDMTQSAKDGQAGQQFLESEGNLAKQQTTVSNMAKSVDLQPDSSFSQALNQAADKPTTATAETFRPVTVPFTSQQVTENDILNQVTQRLRISNITQDTKLVMRLHPAELGNLKVDIHLKDGTVNANIVAQSQQVHEILEKHMPRLRELMEQNGLQVGEIAIHLDSDLPTEQNLFEEQLAQQHDMESGNNKAPNSESFVLTPEEEEESKEQQATTVQGVNLKA